MAGGSGGGMSNVDELYRDLPELMRPHVLSSEFETPILKPLRWRNSLVCAAPRGSGTTAMTSTPKRRREKSQGNTIRGVIRRQSQLLAK